MSIEEIKRKKLEELQSRMMDDSNPQIQEELKMQQQIEMLENIAKQHLTKEAIQRYGNLRLAHQEKAIQVITLIVQAAQAGQLKEKIDDAKFKKLLKQLDTPKKEFKLRKV
ncbi:MAG: DNA-binding protein [Candidatus Nanoarchaeia archaeon]|jgi:programmed cell death protein 5|nr:DNA-binding protein [Candidatus Nanoarchaeia archaeon]|tara:strand:- start:24539 stop:24871 length:333 start_codon:yes stop_codon:yes gene_type:complete